MYHNTIDIITRLQDFQDERLRFTVSSRRLQFGMDIGLYLKTVYGYCNFTQIESVFGSTVFYSRLYGGRLYHPDQALTDLHIAFLEEQGIGISLNLTNHFFDQENYVATKPLLQKLHKKGNSIICTNDELALRLKHDFPDYTLRASIIKKLDTLEKIAVALKLYDVVVIPMDKNDDDAFLKAIPEKDRIVIFGNGACAYTCPQRSCYLGISQRFVGKNVSSGCSRNRLPRPDKGNVFFDVIKFADMGYRHIKLVPLMPL